MAYDNNSTPSGILWAPTKAATDWAVRPGTTQRETPYTTLDLDPNVSDQDQIVVVRTFPISSVTPTPATPFTGEQVWKLWTLPKTDSSGSAMYSLSTDNTVVMSETAADYKIEIDGTEYTTPVFDYASHDTYILRRTYSKEGFVSWTAGSRITSAQLNHSMQQVINLLQEGIIRDLNRDKFDPFIDQANGVASLDSDGKIPNSLIGASTLGINTELGIQGAGTTEDKLRIKLNGASLAATSDGLSVSVVNDLTTGGTTVALSAEQGKILKTSLDTLGTGFAYQGSFDISGGADIDPPTSAAAGYTYDVIGSGTYTMSKLNNLSLTAGDIIRYDGSAWVEVAQASVLRADGTVALESSVTLDLDAGTSVLVPNVTYGTSVDDTKAANTAYVKDAIEAIQVETLSDVDFTGVAAKSVIQSDGDGTWSLKKGVFDENVECTGLKLQNLSDVDDSPDDGQFLKYTTSGGWDTAAVSITNLVVGVNGSANFSGGADASQYVQDAWVDSTLGHTGTPTSSTLRVLEFNGAKHLLGDHGTTVHAIPTAANRVFTTHKQDVTYRNGHLQWKGIDTIGGSAADAALYPYMISPTDATGASTGSTCYLQTKTLDGANGGGQKLAQTIKASTRQGETKLTVTSTSSMAVGQVIKIMNVDTTAEVVRDDSDGGNKYYFTMTNRIKKVLSDTQIEVETPLPSECTADKQKIEINLYHVTNATQASGLSQPSRLNFENMTFENLCSRYFELGSNPVDNGNTGGTDFMLTLPQDHGFTTANQEVLASLDSISLWNSDGTTERTASTFIWDDINRAAKDTAAAGTSGPGKLQFKAGETGITTGVNKLTGKLANSKSFKSDFGGAVGGDHGVVGIGYERCMRINDGQDIVFRNCKFDGWAEAVILDGCYNVTFDNCTFNSPLWTGTGPNSTGIKLIGCTNVTVKDCTFNGAHYAIKNIDSAEACYNIRIKDTRFNEVCCAAYLLGINKNVRIENCDMISRPWNVRRLAASRGIDNSSWALEIEGYNIFVTNSTFDGKQNYLLNSNATEGWLSNKYGRSNSTSTYFDVAGGFDGGNFDSSSPNQYVGITKGLKFIITGKVMEGGNAQYRNGSNKDLVVDGNSVRAWDYGICVETRAGGSTNAFPVQNVDIINNTITHSNYGIVFSMGFDTCREVNMVDIRYNNILSDYTLITNIPRGLSTQRDIWAYRYGEIANGGYGTVGSDNDNAHYGNTYDYLGAKVGIRVGANKDPWTDNQWTGYSEHLDICFNKIDMQTRTQHEHWLNWGMIIGQYYMPMKKMRWGNIVGNRGYAVGYALTTVAVANDNVGHSNLHGYNYLDNSSHNQEYAAYTMHRYTQFDANNREYRHRDRVTTSTGL